MTSKLGTFSLNLSSGCLTSLCLVLLVGCGESRVPTYPVSGTVVFEDGSPVRTGTVELSSIDQELTATGKISDDGSFVLGTYKTDDGAPAGNHRVIVMQMIINDGTVNHTKDHGQPVDPMYASYGSSPLTATVLAQERNTLKLTVIASSRSK